MKSNYLLEYIDTFSYNQKKTEIIEKEKFLDSSISEYDLQEDNLDNILEDLDTYNFLTPRKIIQIKNIDLLDINSKLTIHLLKYLDNPDQDKLVIMASNKLDTRKKIVKDLKNKVNYLKIENDPSAIIKSELKDYKLESGVIALLEEYTNNNLDAIKTECEKLRQYKFNEKEIKNEDIKSICLKHLGDSTQLIFDLVKNICSKNKKTSLIMYQKLHEYNIDDISIIGLLESQLRLLEQVSILLDKNKYKQEIANILEIHPYRIEKTIELLREVSKSEVEDLLNSLGKIDYNIKAGIYDTKKPIEMLLLNL